MVWIIASYQRIPPLAAIISKMIIDLKTVQINCFDWHNASLIDRTSVDIWLFRVRNGCQK